MLPPARRRRTQAQRRDLIRSPLAPADESTARLLQKTYTALKRNWTGSVIRRTGGDQGNLTCFRKAALRMRGVQTRGYPVHPARFCWAVFQHFGAQTYPSHFISETVWDLYFAWEEHRSAAVVVQLSFGAELDTLQHLAACRTEPLKTLWPKVRHSGLFSPRFVRYFNQRVA